MAARFVDLYRRVALALGAVALAGMTGATALQVFCRYVLNAPLFWPEELCRYLMIWITFLLAGLAFDRGELVNVDAVLTRMGSRIAAVLAAIGAVAGLALSVLIAIHGWGFAAGNLRQTAPALQISVAWIYAAVPLGMGLLSLHIAVALWRHLRVAAAAPDGRR